MTAGMLPVSKRAVLQRINRKLRKNMEMVRTLRGHRWQSDGGRFFRVDLDRNVLIQKHVDLDQLAKDLGVLYPYEEIVDEQPNG
jgi:hypothetical protein